MITSHRIPHVGILCIFMEVNQQVRHLSCERESTKKATNGIKRKMGSHKSGDVPHTNSSM